MVPQKRSAPLSKELQSSSQLEIPYRKFALANVMEENDGERSGKYGNWKLGREPLIWITMVGTLKMGMITIYQNDIGELSFKIY